MNKKNIYEFRLERLVKQKKMKRLLRRGLALLSAVVLLFTMNTLKYKADTLERIPACGLQEHVHSAECYAEDGATLICGLEQHEHTDACYQQRPVSDDEAPEAEAQEGEAVDVEVEALEEVALGTAENEPAEPELPEDEEEPAVAEADAYSYSMAGRESVKLSEVLETVQMPVQLSDIAMIGLVDGESDAPAAELLAIQPEARDFTFVPLRDFERVEVAVVTDSDILTFVLTDAVAPAEEEVPEPEAQAEEEKDEADGQIEEAEKPGEEIVEETEGTAEESEEETVEKTEETVEESEETVEESEETVEESEEETEEETEETEEETAEESEETAEESEDTVEESEETEEETAEESEETAEESEETVEETVEETAEETEEESEETAEETEEESEETAEEAEEAEATEGEEAAETEEESEAEETEEDEEVVETEEESEAEETEEEAGEEAAESAVSEYAAVIDLSGIGQYPLSLRALLADVETAPVQAEAAGGEDAEAPAEAEPLPASEWIIEYDESLIAVEAVEDDYLITPVAAFDETQIIVDNGSRFALTLTGFVPAPAGEIEAEEIVEAPLLPAQTFEGATDGMKVFVTAEEGAFPEGTTMVVRPVWDEDTLDGIADTVQEDFVDVKRVHAADISFYNVDGEEIEPLIPISVVMTVEELDVNQDAVVVHVNDEGAAEVVDSCDASADAALALDVEMPAAENAGEILEALVAAENGAVETAAEEPEAEAASEDAVAFEADAFSVYAVVVTETIETRYIAADGATYNISVGFGPDSGIPADAQLDVRELTGAASEACLAETAGALRGFEDITLARFFDITILYEGQPIQPAAPVEVRVTLADGTDDDVRAVHFDHTGGMQLLDADREDEAVMFSADSFSVYGVVYTVDFHYEVNGETFDYSMPGGGCLSLKALVAALGIAADDPGTDADELAAFIESIDSAVFSRPELVAVSKVTEDASVGGIKAALGLEAVYSDALTEEEIAAIDAIEIKAVDWALISLQPFDTQETLTVTMNNGDVFTIAVTDAQISTHVITADGLGFVITVTYNDFANIPEGAELYAEELLPGTLGYEASLTQSANALLTPRESIAFARFFDIEILKDGEKIEPAVPVEVSIVYDEALNADENRKLSVVHFADAGTEVIETLALNADGNEITYRQDSFSITGTLITSMDVNVARQDYFVILKQTVTDEQNNPVEHYYLVLNDGSLEPITIDQNGKFRVNNPMMWQYTTENGKHYLSHTSLSRTIGDWRDPNSPAGINRPEALDPIIVPENEADDARTLSVDATNADKKQQSAIEAPYDRKLMAKVPQVDGNGNLVKDWNGNIQYQTVNGNPIYHYIGIEGTGEGAHMVGCLTDPSQAAELSFATVDQISTDSAAGEMARNHIVDHIDIGIDATAALYVPLLPVTYYDANHQPISEEIIQNYQMLRVEQKVEITEQDIKDASLTAFTKNGKARVNKDEAFYITGYTCNEVVPNAPRQVRIEGHFRTSAADPLPNNQDPYEPDQWYLNQRLAQKIYYTVTVTKRVTFNLVIDMNPEGTPDDQKDPSLIIPLYNAKGERLTTTAMVDLSASFNYWDSNNSCPALFEGFDVTNQRWQPYWDGNANRWWKGWLDENGHETGIIPRKASGNSGMDFLLSGQTEGVAVVITKLDVDEYGHRLSLKSNSSNEVQIWWRPIADASNPWAETDEVKEKLLARDSTDQLIPTVNGNSSTLTIVDSDGNRRDGQYSYVTSKDITVGTDGYGTVYDYTIDPGMVAVRETSYSPTLTDQKDKVWRYDHTYLVTEYVKRNSSDPKKKVHYTRNYNMDEENTENGILFSVPEVLGPYKLENGADYNERFLEFYIYNVYKPDKTSVIVHKDWEKEDGTEYDGHLKTEVQVQIGRYKLIPDENFQYGEDTTARVKVYLRNYKKTVFVNDRDLKAGDTITLVLKRKYNESISYSVNGEADVSLQVYPDNSGPTWRSDTITLTIPDSGLLLIDFDDEWNSISGDGEENEGQLIVKKGETVIENVDTGYEPNISPDEPDMVYVPDNDAQGNPICYGTITLNAGNNWEDELGGLDLYDENGKEYLYYIIGETGSDGTMHVIGKNADGTMMTANTPDDPALLITNVVPSTTVTIQKTDKTGETLLSSAEFRLWMLKNGSWTVVAERLTLDPDTARVTVPELFDGSYRLEETKAPAGYIILNKYIYFNISDGTVMLANENGSLTDSEAYNNMVTVGGTMFRIKNEPGVSLPDTGGPGTRGYTIAGAAMALLAIALLLLRKRDA